METFPVAYQNQTNCSRVCQRGQMVKVRVGEGKQEDSGMHRTDVFDQSGSGVKNT